MKEKMKNDFFDLTSKIRIHEAENKMIHELEKQGETDKLIKLHAKLDKMQAGVTLDQVAGISNKVVNKTAFMVKETNEPNMIESAAIINPSVLATLTKIEEIKCNCIIPFAFDRLRVLDNISGPANNDVTRGIIGANRYYDSEYMIFNPGDTNGTTRVHSVGSLDILFSAVMPATDRYCLLLPVGNLWINGKSRVLGHGHSWNCYDSKIWFDYFSFLHLDGNILEASHTDLFYDGTRSEDRTKVFYKIIKFSPRYLFFSANAGQKLELIMRIQVDTAANEDGKTWGYVNMFGFPANDKTDYDTMVIRS